MITKKKSSRSWEASGLPEWCLEAISSMGFAEPTPSQAAAIPLFLANSDVVVEAPTGSGKSLAFLIPLAVRILRRFGATEDTPATPIKRGHVAALVLAPTRELADQLHRVLLELIAFHPPSAAVLPYVQRRQRPDVQAAEQVMGKRNKKKAGKTGGGESVMGAGRARARAGGASAYSLAANGLQIAGELDEASAAIPTNSRRPETAEPVLVPQLVVGGATSKPAADLACFVRQGSNILVGTPGRLAELLTSTAVNATESFEALVLDEADRLLDLGFAADLQRILAFVPKQRRTFLCSASVNDAIGELIKVNLRNPKRVVVRVQARQQKQEKLAASSAHNNATASSAVEEKKTPASLINTYVVLPSSHKLPALMHLLDVIEPRPLRTLVFLASCFSVKYFSSVLPAVLPPGYSLLSLHATDVASRGLDVPAVDLVVNIDPPTDPKTFLHRCGRTGRAGRRGLAVTMLRPGREADDYVSFLAVRKTPVEPLASAVPALAARMPVDSAAEAAAGVLAQTMRRQVLADRDLYQLSQRAFVSWARAFQEHQAGSIFRVADLDWVDLGHAWGLARLPKMPELRAIGLTDRSLGLGPDVRVDDIPFKDKVKEKRRLAELQAARAAAAADMNPAAAAAADASNTRKRNAAWSLRQDRDTLRTERREKKRRKRTAEQLALMTPEERAEYDRVEALVARIRQKNVEAGWELDEEGRDVVVSKKKNGAAATDGASAGSKKALKEEALDDSFDGFDD